MSEPDQRGQGLIPPQESGLAVPASIVLGLNIKSPNMDYYLLTDDRLETLAGGAESLDLAFAGIAFGCFLTAVGIAVPMYVSGQTGRVFLAICVLAPVCLGASVYLGVRGWQIRSAFQEKLKRLRADSKTVVTVAPLK